MAEMGTGEMPSLGGINVVKANWRFLPNPETMDPIDLIRELRDHFSACGNSALDFEEDRIDEAFRFGPRQICIGTEEFFGYYAFVLDRGVNIFECPVYGNAAYVVRGDWSTLSQFSKNKLKSLG